MGGLTLASSPIEILRQAALFASCTDQELERIAAAAQSVVVPSGTRLTDERRVGHKVFVIADGEADASRRGRQLATLGPGAMVGEMALLDGRAKVVTVTARTDLAVLVLDARRLWALMAQTPSLARTLMQVVAARVRQLEGPLS
jgi:CRP/FNR family cyclic AMP-dependent transcriptional regulator